jgi:hypothetical protein
VVGGLTVCFLGRRADNPRMRAFGFSFVLLFSALLSAAESKCPSAQPDVDPVATIEQRQDSTLANWDKQLPLIAAKPNLLGLEDLRRTVGNLERLEADSMQDAFRLTGGHSVRSVPSAELNAHLEVMKSVKKAAVLLAEAKEATESHEARLAQLRIAAAAKEMESVRKELATKRKVRAARAAKAKSDPKSKPKK